MTRSWYASPAPIKPGSPLPNAQESETVWGPYLTYTDASDVARTRYASALPDTWVCTAREGIVTHCSRYQPRRLPYTGSDTTRLVENEVGTFVAQPVGSTEYCTGLHVWAHLKGEAEAAHGLFAFHASIQEDGTVSWSQMQPHYVLHHERAAEVLPVMLGIAQDWINRDPIHYLIHVRDMADRELRTHLHKLRSAEDSKKHLTKLLADPLAPTKVGRKGEDGVWRDEPPTPEEKAERREFWLRNLARYTSDLTKYHAKYDARIAQLTQAKTRIDAYIRAKDKDRGSVPVLPPAPPP